MLGERLANISGGIARFLAARQLPDGKFPARNFYGKAFAALLWSQHGTQFDHHIKRALGSIAEECRGPLPRNYHFEFNRFALIQLFRASPDLGSVKEILGPEQYTGTRVANWTLLRAYCRYESGTLSGRLLGRAEIQAVKWWFSDPSGLIEDQRGSYTMQYHAFSAALLGELLSGPLKGSTWIQSWFERSVASFAELTLPGGQCNYIGRGSLQSFGYAAALLSFTHAWRTTGDQYYLDKMEAVLGYLQQFQREDGSIPLVLSDSTEGDPKQFDLLNPAYAGWWSYNNFYDYLPFTGALMGLARKVLDQPCYETMRCSSPHEKTARLGQSLLLVRKRHYTAVVTTPNKVWASSQPIPFLAVGGAYPLPIYGGEQGVPSLYSQHGLPLPVVELEGGGEILLANAAYRWVGESTFAGEISGVRHVREFRFLDRRIEIQDDVSWLSHLSVKAVRAPRLMLPENKAEQDGCGQLQADGVSIQCDSPLEPEKEVVFGPQGPMRTFCARTPSNQDTDGRSRSFRMVLIIEKENTVLTKKPARIRSDHNRFPKVSIVMTAYNAASTIRASLAAALAQNYPDHEVIVVDDGSSDDTEQICRGIADPRLRYIRKGRIGRSQSLNEGVSLARGEYIAINDADDLSLPNRLEYVLGFLERHKDIAFVGTAYAETRQFYQEIPSPLLVDEAEPTRLPAWISRVRLYRSNPFAHSTVVFPKTTWERVGGYDTQLKICVDYDFFLRAMKVGKMAWLPRRTLLYYRNPASFFRSKSTKEYLRALLRIKRRARRAAQMPGWIRLYELIDVCQALRTEFVKKV